MPFVQGPLIDPGSLREDRSPESKRTKEVGDLDLDNDEGMQEEDAAMEVLLSLGMKGPEARRTMSEIYSPPRITQAAR
eukprot:16426900-Heterocapsa_arctica.AAC.1